MVHNSIDNRLYKNLSFKDKIKEISKDNPFTLSNEPDASSFHISNTDDGLHIFIGKDSPSNFNATIINEDGVTFNINNDAVEPIEEDKKVVKEVVKDASYSFLEQAKKTMEKVKSAISKVDDLTEGAQKAYKKTNKAMSKMFVAVAFVSSIAQVGNIASIAHDNDYSWQPTVTELRDYYAPIYEDFDKNKDIYSICQQDKSLCVTSGALVALVASKSMALTGTGIAVMVAGDVSEDQTRLNTFLKSIEKATGYALTSETSEKNRLEREKELNQTIFHSDKEIQKTSQVLENTGFDNNRPVPNDKNIERTKVNDRVRDTSEISRNNNKSQTLNM